MTDKKFTLKEVQDRLREDEEKISLLIDEVLAQFYQDFDAYPSMTSVSNPVSLYGRYPSRVIDVFGGMVVTKLSVDLR